jgi:hypothetical protein
MDGSFTSGRFRFQVEGSDWLTNLERGFSEDFHDDTFALRLESKIPALGYAPIASWYLARLARLTDGYLGLAGEEHVDGGGYVIEFVTYLLPAEPEDKNATVVQPWLFDPDEWGVYPEPEKPVASFQFQAEMEGAAVIGHMDPECPVVEMMEAFAAALAAAPTELRICEVVVWDPEWKLDREMYTPRPVRGSRNFYGWDGFHFLGEDNIREAPLPKEGEG